MVVRVRRRERLRARGAMRGQCATQRWPWWRGPSTWSRSLRNKSSQYESSRVESSQEWSSWLRIKSSHAKSSQVTANTATTMGVHQRNARMESSQGKRRTSPDGGAGEREGRMEGAAVGGEVGESSHAVELTPKSPSRDRHTHTHRLRLAQIWAHCDA
jgi:hypothetical protein